MKKWQWNRDDSKQKTQRQLKSILSRIIIWVESDVMEWVDVVNGKGVWEAVTIMQRMQLIAFYSSVQSIYLVFFPIN